MKAFDYSIYGLTLKSSREIKLLAPLKFDKIDLNVSWFSAQDYSENSEWVQIITPDLKSRKGITFFESISDLGIKYKVNFIIGFGVLCFILDETKNKLTIIYPSLMPESDLDSFFVGAILGVVLRLKGVLCLHSSVINIEGKAVLVMGKKRSGKSTSAAYFAKMGYEIIADDLATISIKNEVFFVESGYSKIRLRPKSYDFFNDDYQKKTPLVYTDRDSRYVNLEKKAKNKSLQIAAIFHLKQIDTIQPTIKEYNQIEKIVHLNSNTFGNYVVQPNHRKKEFELLNQIAKVIPVFELTIADNLLFLPKQCEIIIRFLKQNSFL
jgi:hypothetical protein